MLLVTSNYLQTFMYLLCQLSVRALVSRIFNFGVRKSLQKVVEDNPLAKYMLEPKAE
jgi:hypothetical protein